MRINKILSQITGKSRRKIDELITRASIEVNGELVELGQQIEEADIKSIRIYERNNWKTFDIENLNLENDVRTMLMYKPIFAIASKFDPQKRKTIYDYLPKRLHELKSAGRLDYMSEGLLVLTNDGDLIYNLTHPSQDKEKVYLVGMRSSIPQKMIADAAKGMTIEDYKLEPVKITGLTVKELEEYHYLALNENFNWYSFTLKEGRNNQIRKMCGNFGFNVNRLIRVKHGDYKLDEKLFAAKYMVIDNGKENKKSINIKEKAKVKKEIKDIK
jgi:23S rRNA pseudouridine2605 synthase